MFIPFINISIMVIWFFINLRNDSTKSYYKEFFKSFFFACLSFIFVIPMMVILGILENTAYYGLIELAVYYVWSVLTMGLLIVYQKKRGYE